MYDSVPYEDDLGWFTIGGTSAATVMVAAESAVTGADVNAAYVYASPANIPFRDITVGSNGYPALPGYNLATGLGSWSYIPAPNGLNAIGASPGLTLGGLEHHLRHGDPVVPQEDCNAAIRQPGPGCADRACSSTARVIAERFEDGCSCL